MVSVLDSSQCAYATLVQPVEIPECHQTNPIHMLASSNQSPDMIETPCISNSVTTSRDQIFHIYHLPDQT